MASSSFDTIVIPPSPTWGILSNEEAAGPMGWRQPQYDCRLRGNDIEDGLDARLHANGFPIWGRMLLSTVDYAEDIRRFVDIRNPLYNGTPARDGSNMISTGGVDAKRAFLYHQKFLTALYYRNLLTARPPPAGMPANTISLTRERLHQLKDVMNDSERSAREREEDRLKNPHNAGSPIRPGFEWVNAWQESLADGVASVQAVFSWAEEYGYDPMDHVQKAWESIPDMSRLLIILIWREECFEFRLAEEHVEDILMDKRIWWLLHTVVPRIGVQIANNIVRQEDQNMKPLLADYQRDMRECFDYRQLRDWTFGRHWHKMFLVFDTAESPGQTQYIQAFRAFVQNHSKFAYNLFGVHPIEKKDLDVEDPCSVCICEFENDELVMELKCKHRFHPSCIFGHWDSDTIFNNPCTNCRQSQGRLRDRIEFHAEKEDIDYFANPGLQANEAAVYDTRIHQYLEQHIPISIWEDLPLERFWRVNLQLMRKRDREAAMAQDPNWNKLE